MMGTRPESLTPSKIPSRHFVEEKTSIIYKSYIGQEERNFLRLAPIDVTPVPPIHRLAVVAIVFVRRPDLIGCRVSPCSCSTHTNDLLSFSPYQPDIVDDNKALILGRSF